MRQAAGSATAATVLDVLARVGFATISGIAVAIPVRRGAIRNPTDALFTNGCTVGDIGANVATAGTVRHGAREIHLAAIRDHVVAVSVVLKARDGTLPCAAARCPVDRAAGIAAAATMGRIRLQIDLAAVRR